MLELHGENEHFMATVTDFYAVYSDGTEAKADPFGNNVAFACADCGYPVLAVARKNQRGSSIENTSVCNGCRQHYVIEVRETTHKIIIYRAHEL